MKKDVTVIIPTWKPGKELTLLLQRLKRQTVRPQRILIINTDETSFREELVEDWSGISMLHIEKRMFDHAGTRDMAARMSASPYLLFMTMDALPADTHLIENLLDAFRDEHTAVAYARQLPKKNAGICERHVRAFNYPDRSFLQREEDIPQRGIRTYFCSNVCAMYRKDVYLELGGFRAPAIFNEDMVFAAEAVSNGWQIAYRADARVYHSHNYSARKQLKRNFDLGVSQKMHPEIFEAVPAEGTGMRMIREVAGKLAGEGHFAGIAALIWQSAWKYAGYLAGKHYQQLPPFVIRALTMNPEFWDTYQGK